MVIGIATLTQTLTPTLTPMKNKESKLELASVKKTIPRMLIELDTLASVSASVYELNDKQISTICDLTGIEYSDIIAFRLDLFNLMSWLNWDCIQVHFDESGNVVAVLNFNPDI